MMQISETEAFRACRLLFGGDLRLNREFLQYLQPAGAHSAFRKMAKVTHPDSCHRHTQNRPRQNGQFQDLNQAHQLIQNFIRQRDLLATRQRTGTPRPASPACREQAPSRPAQGPLPTRPLQFGLYLYYRGLIPFQALIGALSWQRQQRPAMGQIAQRWGWIDEPQIGQILASRKTGRFGERAEHLGLLSSVQVRAILLNQRTRQGKIGSYFIEKGLLTGAAVEQLLQDLSEHNLRYRHGFPHHFYYHR